MSPQVAVCIVTYNSADDLPGCFAALAAQDFEDFEVVVVDCDSADRSVRVAESTPLDGAKKTVVALGENRGFSGGMNEAFRRSDAPYLLCLNADARPRRHFLRRLVERAQAPSSCSIGAVTPRLVRPADEDGDSTARLDACGMILVRTWRHLDRGSGEVDTGQYAEPERVFGATGAAVLYVRQALDDVAVDGEIFDEAFHSFREDAELSFRFQERGWSVVYDPAAVAEHRRRVLPQGRRELPAMINYHSLKNRYLLRAYHQTAGNFFRTLLPTLVRDLGALVYVLVFERTSLVAYVWLWRHRREILDRRRKIRDRWSGAQDAVDVWFDQHALPLKPD